jgi:hypothetical protein
MQTLVELANQEGIAFHGLVDAELRQRLKAELRKLY